jgi:hypothetical protein
LRNFICAVPFCRGVPLRLKALKQKDYVDNPETLGQHLMKRRKQLGLLQREAATQMGIGTETYANWEKDKTEPIAAQFRPVLDFLGYDPMPAPVTLAERVQTKRRQLGVTFEQMAEMRQLAFIILSGSRASLVKTFNSVISFPSPGNAPQAPVGKIIPSRRDTPVQARAQPIERPAREARQTKDYWTT